jgi:membrane-bound metal-dependent hydrolase YbcI (DUF457 family)
MMIGFMPSPIGHTLAGLAIAWFTDRPARPTPAARPWNPALSAFAVACVLVSVLPDADLLYPPIHRTVTHSIGATILVIIIAAAVTGKVTPGTAWRTAAILGAAHASHILLDWLGTDRFPPAGLQALWPFSDRFYISGWDLFPPTERRHLLSWTTIVVNLNAAAREVVLIGPVTLLAWLVMRRRRTRVPISAPDVPRPPSAAAEDTAGT